MGVIRNLRNSAPIISFSEESINSLGISQPATPPSEPESVDEPREFVVERRDPTQLIHRLENHRINARLGARKTRRANNARVLQTLLEDEDESVGEPTIIDFQPKTDGAFTKLFNDIDNMRVWQYFISRDEKEQQDFLEAVSPSHNHKERKGKRGISFTQVNTTTADTKIDQFPEADGFTVVPMMSDCRNVHPAYVEEQRFSSLEPSLQAVFRKRSVPLGMMSSLEEEIVDVFSSDPLAVYITQVLSSYERLLLHAICRYNFLSSKSSTIAGKRRTKVENEKKCFHAPKMPLSRYVKTYIMNKK
ncbi:hypothetical protein Pmani_030799 [Petrolisthes manimaculis]|uniref:R3H-associated N-terminal domain-containing protein n=1 Tax=Petrolisthes manimaculis TaxID=1843537 RepID=A0AAE1TT83_9EUCA|nr:hypothetical protein Pmani_030799 [Petrolisthes manimaculis]